MSITLASELFKLLFSFSLLSFSPSLGSSTITSGEFFLFLVGIFILRLSSSSSSFCLLISSSLTLCFSSTSCFFRNSSFGISLFRSREFGLLGSLISFGAGFEFLLAGALEGLSGSESSDGCSFSSASTSAFSSSDVGWRFL